MALTHYTSPRSTAQVQPDLGDGLGDAGAQLGDGLADQPPRIASIASGVPSSSPVAGALNGRPYLPTPMVRRRWL